MYQSGTPIGELVKSFHLSEDSIRKIITKKRLHAAGQRA
jgi:Mor family transcriptional regulator